MFYAVFSIMAAVLLLLDQWVKRWTEINVPYGETRPLFGVLLELQTVHNYGAAWSIFSGRRWFLIILTLCLLSAIAILLIRRSIRHPAGICATFLILAGGLSNLIDRVRFGYVVDMLHFPFWSSYPIFNIADMCIVSGCILAVIYFSFFGEEHTKKNLNEQGEENDIKGL